jgi:hypothetical protein
MSTARATALWSWSGPATVATQRTFSLVVSSPVLKPFQLCSSPHFVSNWSSLRMFSGSDDEETDDRKTTTVFDYFNDLKFFKKERDRLDFVNRLNDLDEEEKMMLMKTTHEFFEVAWKIEMKDEKGEQEHFFRDHIFGCERLKVVTEYSNWKDYYGYSVDNDKTNDHPR